MTLSQTVRRVVVIACCLLAGLVVGFGFVVPAMVSLHAEPTAAQLTDPMSQDIHTMELAIEYGCSSEGLDGVIPAGALVWRGDHTEHTTFEEGWAVRETGSGGVLLAVCER